MVIRVGGRGPGRIGSRTSTQVFPLPDVAPVNTRLPVVLGSPNIGATLSVDAGTWTGTPSPTLTYLWKAGGVSTGITTTTYVVQPGDAGKAITVTVTATNVVMAVSATSGSVNVPQPAMSALSTTNKGPGVTLSNNNLTMEVSTAWQQSALSDAPLSGRVLFSATPHTDETACVIGVCNLDQNLQGAPGDDYTNGIGYAWNAGNVIMGGASDFLGAADVDEEVWCLFDEDAGKVWFHVNGAWSGDPDAGTGGYDLPSGGGPFYACLARPTGGTFDFDPNPEVPTGAGTPDPDPVVQYAALSTTNKGPNVALSNGDRTITVSTDYGQAALCDTALTGKICFGFTAQTSNVAAIGGICSRDQNLYSYPGDSAVTGVGYGYNSGFVLRGDGAFVAITAAGVETLCAVDTDLAKVWFRIDGVWDGDPAAGTGGYDFPTGPGPFFPAVSCPSGGTMDFNPNPDGKPTGFSGVRASSGPTTGAAPANTSPPTLSGTLRDGQTLTTNVGAWSNAPTSYTYAYYFDGVLDGAQTGSTVSLTGKVGQTVRVIVTAINAQGSAPASSAVYGPIQAVAPFSFNPVFNADLSTVYESNTVTIATGGSISIVGGEYKINAGAYTSASGTISDGDTVRVRVTSSASPGTTVRPVLTINGFSGDFQVTTEPVVGRTVRPVTLGDCWGYGLKVNNDLSVMTNWQFGASAFSSWELLDKGYFEVEILSIPCAIGVGTYRASLEDYAGGVDGHSIGMMISNTAANGIIFRGGSGFQKSMQHHNPGVGDVIGVAYDATLRKVYFSVNGAWSEEYGSDFDPDNNTGGITVPNDPIDVEIAALVTAGEGSSGGAVLCNFGASPFRYAIPSGFVAVNDTASGAPPDCVPQTIAPTKPTNFPQNFWDYAAPATYSAPPATPTFYVDSGHPNASDSNSGRSPDTPWRSLAAVNQRSFNPGTVIAFKCGTSYQPQVADDAEYTFTRTRLDLFCHGRPDAKIYLTNYGSGPKPIIYAADNPYASCIVAGHFEGERNASYVQIDGFDLRGVRHADTVGIMGAGGVHTIGNEAGVKFNHSHHIEVYHCDISLLGAGIIVRDGSHDITFRYNWVHDGKMIWNSNEGYLVGDDQDAGANGLIVGGERITVTDIDAGFNSFTDIITPSYDYEMDGGALELFGYIWDVEFHHNFIKTSQGLAESGGRPGNAQNIDIHHNIVVGTQTMSVFHNDPNGNFPGVIYNLDFRYNTVYQTTPPTSGGGYLALFHANINYGSDSIHIENNLLYATQGVSGFFGADARPYISPSSHSNNVFYRGGTAATDLPIMAGFGSGGFENEGLGTGDTIISDPLFTDPTNDDFTLQGGSPATGKGAFNP